MASRGNRKTVPCVVVDELLEGVKDERRFIRQIVEKELGFEVTYDSEKKQLILEGDDADILNLALDTLQNWKESPPDDGLEKRLEGGKVVWKFYGDSGQVCKHFFGPELAGFEPKIQTSYCKAPVVFKITWDRKHNGSAIADMSDVDCAYDKLDKTIIDVKKDDNMKAKATKAQANRSDPDAMCIFKANTSKLHVYGRTAAYSQRIVDEFTEMRKGAVKDTGRARKGTSEFALAAGGHPVSMAGTSGAALAGSLKGASSSVKKNGSDTTFRGAGLQPVPTEMPGYGTNNDQNIGKNSSTLLRPGEDASSDRGQVRNHVASLGRAPNASSSKFHYCFTSGTRTMRVFVYDTSIVTIRGMDAIVNAANSRLRHAGGVAQHIAKAAGRQLEDECSDFIQRHGQVDVTENCVTTGGGLPCSRVIHAVGPQWADYRGSETRCARDLYRTITNILKTAEEQRLSKIALTAISSGIYGVPKELCAEMYVKAFVDFGKSPHQYPTEVHLVDINLDILKMVEDAHHRWETDSASLDFKNAVQHVGTTVTVASRRTAKQAKGQQVSVTFQGKQRRPVPEVWTYSVGPATIKLYSGDLLKLTGVDAIACTVGPDFQGVLANAVSRAGGPKYAQHLKELQRTNPRRQDGQVFRCPGGYLRMDVLLVCLTHTVEDTSANQLHRIKRATSNILLEARKFGYRSIALPLVGAGRVKSPTDVRKIATTCVEALVETANECPTEVHLVNLDPAATAQIQAEMRRRSEQSSREFDNTPLNPTRRQGQSDAEMGRFPRSRRDMESSAMISSTKGEVTRPSYDDTEAILASAIKPSAGRVEKEVTKKLGEICDSCEKKPPKESLKCGHSFCKGCFLPMNKGQGCVICSVTGGAEKPASNTMQQDSESSPATCPICMDKPTDAVELKCGHCFCQECIRESFTHKPACPCCGAIFGAVTGNQPEGRMEVFQDKRSLPGYERVGMIVISYEFPGGTQTSDHPHPGKRYRGTRRVAYLPDNADGNKVLGLLQRAFENKLVFTIGESRTTGEGDVVTWNDIHHKTKQDGGPSNFGYPDPEYLQRVLEELAAKGITE